MQLSKAISGTEKEHDTEALKMFSSCVMNLMTTPATSDRIQGVL